MDLLNTQAQLTANTDKWNASDAEAIAPSTASIFHTGVRRSVRPHMRRGTPQHTFRLFKDQLTNHLTADFLAQLAPIRGGRGGFGQ